MKKIIRALVLAGSMLACTVHADPVIGVHIGSQHFPKQDFNNFNPGVYVRFNNGFTAGGYYNSERRPSVYAGYTHEWGRLGITVGGITGYKHWPIMPMVVPSIEVGKIGSTAIRLAYVPKVEKSGSHVFHLMLEF